MRIEEWLELRRATRGGDYQMYNAGQRRLVGGRRHDLLHEGHQALRHWWSTSTGRDGVVFAQQPTPWDTPREESEEELAVHLDEPSASPTTRARSSTFTCRRTATRSTVPEARRGHGDDGRREDPRRQREPRWSSRSTSAAGSPRPHPRVARRPEGRRRQVPGSEYSEGLKGVIIMLDKKKVKDYVSPGLIERVDPRERRGPMS